MGIQCAFFHSTVDDSFAPGIGKRLDGWANRDSDRQRDRHSRRGQRHRERAPDGRDGGNPETA